MKCNRCDAEMFERRGVTFVSRVGHHEVTQRQVGDVCLGCESWSIDDLSARRYQLQGAQSVLLENELTGPIATDVRKALGLSQLALAEQLEISEANVAAWEGDAPPKAWYRFALAGLLAVALTARAALAPSP